MAFGRNYSGRKKRVNGKEEEQEENKKPSVPSTVTTHGIGWAASCAAHSIRRGGGSISGIRSFLILIYGDTVFHETFYGMHNTVYG